MTQNFDVTLAGNGYMLVPPPERPGVAGASYRLTVTPFKPAGVRTGIRDWAAALNDTDGTRWRADGMLPELSGYGTVQGLVLGPAVRATPAYTNVFTAAAVFNGALYLATGNYLFKLTLDAGLHVLSTATVGTTAGNITGMFVSTGRLYLALASPATSYASTDGTTITAAPGTQTGTQGFGYANGTWLVSRTSANTLAGSIDGGATWTYLQTEGAIRCTLATGRTALIFHAAGVDELTGQWVTSTSGGTTTTAFTGTLAPLVRATGAGAFADFLWAVDYGGHVYVWHNGTVRLLDRSSITGGRLTDVKGPRGTGVAAVVAAGRLWVAVVTTQYELWSYDGARWVRHLNGGAVTIGLLASVAGLATDADVLIFQTTLGYAQSLLTSAVGHTAYPASTGVVVCGPWDAGRPDSAKTWTEVEVVWNVPDRAGAPSGGLLVETSTNGGASYTSAGTTPILGTSGGTIRAPLTGVSGETLTVRVTWTPSANGTGFRLLALHANGWELPAAPAVKRWTLRVRCSDLLLNRAGNVDARTGEAMRAALVGLAATGTPIAYADLDYDANPATQTVRVIEAEESARRGDGTHFWESEIAVTLEAIA